MKIVKLVLLLGAVSLIGYLAFLSIFSPKLILENKEGLGEQELISVRAWPQGSAFHLGDSISYFVEIKYNPKKVQEIDKSSIDKTLALAPFVIRDAKAREFTTDSYTKVYLKEYRIQLVRGETSKLYSFPEASVGYRINTNWFEKKITPDPVPMGSRFPSDVTGIGLKPIKKGEVANETSGYFTWVLVAGGILCGVWGLSEIFKKARNRKKELKNREKGLEGIEDIFKAYEGLLLKKEEPKTTLHQVYQILRELLFRKKSASEIQDLTLSLAALCQKAYDRGPLGPKELDEALGMLGKIFDFYIKKEEAR